MSTHVVEIDNYGITQIILFAYPVIIGQGIIFLECLRILPAEFRIWRRSIKRRRFNAAELLFLVIKYFAIVGYSLDIILRTTTFLKTGRQCFITHYISVFFILFDTTLVALAIAWRTYIIFRCNKKVYGILSVALAGQFALSMWAMTRVVKSNINVDGYCDFAYPDSTYEMPVMKLALPYYLLYNALYDLLVTAAATRHLIKSTGASFGISEISRVLFYNNIHYVLVVCTVNLSEAFLLYAKPMGVPSMMAISCAIQIITALNLLASEQDLVHRPSNNQGVSHAPNSGLKSDPTNSSSSMAKTTFSPSSATSHSWQTNTKVQTSTFQSDISTSVGSPLLHSLWHKRARADANFNKQQHGGISVEEKKMQFYDDYSSDVEKQDYGSPREEQSGGVGVFAAAAAAAGNTFIIANPDTSNASRIYQMSNDSNNIMMMTTPLKKQSTSPEDITYTDYIDSPTTKKPTATNGSTTKSIAGNGGISIRSIRANMELASSVDGAMTMSPLRNIQRPNTSPMASTSPITPLSQAKKRDSRVFEGQMDWPAPTFEISPGKGVTGCPRAKVDPAGVAGIHQHPPSKTSLAYFTSQSALRPVVHDQDPLQLLPPRSNNLSTATLDREPTSSFENELSKSNASGTFGRQALSRRFSSLEMDDDPFKS